MAFHYVLIIIKEIPYNSSQIKDVEARMYDYCSVVNIYRKIYALYYQDYNFD